MEANDVWGLSVPFVIAVGATAAEWPAQTDSVVPTELQEAVLAGASETDIVAPRTAWGNGRDRDHFADVMRAAERGVIVTRYTQTVDGGAVYPSPFLASLEMETVSEQARTQLVSTTPQLPEPIAALLSASGASDPAPTETPHE
jgi:ATP-dependent helicase/nuclease subunit B